MRLRMGAHEGLSDDVGALQVSKGAVQIASGDELSAKSDLLVESPVPFGAHLLCHLITCRPIAARNLEDDFLRPHWHVQSVARFHLEGFVIDHETPRAGTDVDDAELAPFRNIVNTLSCFN